MTRRLIVCNNCGSSKHKRLATGRGRRGVAFIEKKHPVVICEECGLIFLNPQHEPSDYAKYYSGLNVKGIDEEHLVHQIKNTHSSSGRSEVRDFLLRNIDRKHVGKSPKLLDVGCGKGVFLYLMQQAGFEVEGLDPGVVEAEFIQKNLGIKVHNGLIDGHDLEEGKYDIVTALAVIEHMNDPKDFIQSLWRLVKPGGYVCLTTPSYRHINLRRGEEDYFKFVHTFYFTGVTLGSLMKQEGFDVANTWFKEPAFKKSILFGKLSTSSGGIICVIGKKREQRANIQPDRDNMGDLITILRTAKREYFWQYSIDRVTRYIKAAIRIMKRKLRLS